MSKPFATERFTIWKAQRRAALLSTLAAQAKQASVEGNVTALAELMPKLNRLLSPQAQKDEAHRARVPLRTCHRLQRAYYVLLPLAQDAHRHFRDNYTRCDLEITRRDIAEYLLQQTPGSRRFARALGQHWTEELATDLAECKEVGHWLTRAMARHTGVADGKVRRLLYRNAKHAKNC